MSRGKLTHIGGPSYDELMPSIFKYGAEASIELDLEPGELLAHCGQPSAVPLDDPAAAAAAALADPLEFPPLTQATVPGDQVAIAIGQGVPEAHALAAGVIQTLYERRTEPGQITVVLSGSDNDASDLTEGLCGDLNCDVKYEVHDPTDRNALAFLGTSAEGKPIYLNRTLTDADVVLPIGCLRMESSLRYYGIFGDLFPTFSDEETLRRFQSATNDDSVNMRRQRRQEAVEAGWLLGVTLTIQVVPGPGNTVLNVLAGKAESVLKKGQQLIENAWSFRVPRRASLVVAAIEGNEDCQTWDNVGRALSAAQEIVTDGGAIALCTELSDQPGAALRSLGQNDDYEAALLQVRKQRSDDAAAAAQLLRALDRNQVYLLSQLDDDVVEQLGMAPIADVTEVARLSRRSESCIVMSNAQYAAPSLVK